MLIQVCHWSPRRYFSSSETAYSLSYLTFPSRHPKECKWSLPKVNKQIRLSSLPSHMQQCNYIALQPNIGNVSSLCPWHYVSQKKKNNSSKLPPFGWKRQKGDNKQSKAEALIAFYLEVMIALQPHMQPGTKQLSVFYRVFLQISCLFQVSRLLLKIQNATVDDILKIFHFGIFFHQHCLHSLATLCQRILYLDMTHQQYLLLCQLPILNMKKML